MEKQEAVCVAQGPIFFERESVGSNAQKMSWLLANHLNTRLRCPIAAQSAVERLSYPAPTTTEDNNRPTWTSRR